MPSNEARLEALALQLGIENIPESWMAHWDAFQAWRSERQGSQWVMPSNAAQVFDLPDEALPDMEEMYRAIRADQPLADLADFWHYLIYHLPGGMERNTNVWDIPERILGNSTKAFSLAAMISGADYALDNFAATGVSDEVVSDTLGYIGRYARDIKAKRGVWGLESVGWLSNYVRADIFRLGRLTFKSGKMGQPFRAFKSRHTNEVIVLCDSSGQYRQDGLSNGTNNVFDADPWSPTLEIGTDVIAGHPVSTEATAVRELVKLQGSEWEQVLAPGDETVEVHVAGGSKLLSKDCADAYRQALDFFPRYYPNANFKGFTIWSWLLDPNLASILPPESNIVRFQRDFHQLPVCADEAQAYDLVFGDSKIDPTKFACTTRLQQAIADYVRAGGKLRSAGGIITWDEARKIAEECRE